jgi:hypothetical protein
LLQNPESGKLVPGPGGVRKIRWAIAGKGNSGGVRAIYHFKMQDGEIRLLTICSKSEIQNIPAHILRQIAKESKGHAGCRLKAFERLGLQGSKPASHLKEPAPPKVIRNGLKLQAVFAVS